MMIGNGCSPAGGSTSVTNTTQGQGTGGVVTTNGAPTRPYVFAAKSIA
jgi:hypothetical protein